MDNKILPPPLALIVERYAGGEYDGTPRQREAHVAMEDVSPSLFSLDMSRTSNKN